MDSYHDCEKNEIVKWFPLYEGDAMFPARKSNVKRERLNKIEKLKTRNSFKRDNKWPEWIFEAETSNRFLSSVWRRLGPDSPHRLFRVHLQSGRGQRAKSPGREILGSLWVRRGWRTLSCCSSSWSRGRAQRPSRHKPPSSFRLLVFPPFHHHQGASCLLLQRVNNWCKCDFLWLMSLLCALDVKLLSCWDLGRCKRTPAPQGPPPPPRTTLRG